MNDRSLIVAGVRTPIGAMNGALATVPAPELGAACIKALLERTGVAGTKIDEVIMGNVIAAGLGQNPARQAAIFAGLPESRRGRHGQQGLRLGPQSGHAGRPGDSCGRRRSGRGRRHGEHDACALSPDQGARGLSPGSRRAARLDDPRRPLGRLRQEAHGDLRRALCRKYEFSRQEQDDFAVRSHTRARQRSPAAFSRPRSCRSTSAPKGRRPVSPDEGPAKFDEAKLRALKPAFGPDGTITAGNASSIGDGAAALLVASRERCRDLKLEPVAEIKGAATFSQQPEWFTTAPVAAIRKLLDKRRLDRRQVDLFEINEAFAVVAMFAERELRHPCRTRSTSSAGPSRSGIRSDAAEPGSWSPCSTR